MRTCQFIVIGHELNIFKNFTEKFINLAHLCKGYSKINIFLFLEEHVICKISNFKNTVLLFK